MWAGVECTVNRVGDRWFDQLARNGHHDRADDVERLAALGVRALRFPVLWERVARDADTLDDARWAWSDDRLARLRALGVRPIVTLLHHGSGPHGTSLLDPRFPARFAAFARAAAERYPWVEEWTPINEPLTTARFSALYGLWYPHARDDRSFARAFLNQMHGIARAMREIRAVNPRARLVQTEDLGKTHAVPSLAAQAALENERRWLTGDVLTGRLAPDDLWWRYLVRHAGVAASELRALVDAPCPPDVVGINHYLTSERFLDPRLSRYPAHTHGGNGVRRYADVEAVRVLREGPDGPERLLHEAWTRYALPIAVTECHLGCTREQQMRWLVGVWGAAERLRARGVDVRAVTAWSALGAFDWASLLTRDDGHYEPGLFDVRAPDAPRPTALAGLVRELAAGTAPSHPALPGPGWWTMPERLLYPAVPVRRARLPLMAASHDDAPAARPVLIVGARGTLGRTLAEACAVRGLAHEALGRAELDCADERAIERAIAAHRPWAIVNAAGFVRVDDAERERDACWRENVCAPVALARVCAAHGVRLATYSSDLVFGDAPTAPDAEPEPWLEHHAPAPRNVYGASKAEAETQVLALMPDALVARTSAFFGPRDDWNFLTIALRELEAGREFRALTDVTVSPTYVPELAEATLDLLIDGAGGVWHLASAGALTWYDFARLGAARAGVDARGIVPQTLAEAALPAPRPRWSVLGTARGRQLGTVENGICQYLAARGAARARPTVAARASRPAGASSSRTRASA